MSSHSIMFQNMSTVSSVIDRLCLITITVSCNAAKYVLHVRRPSEPFYNGITHLEVLVSDGFDCWVGCITGGVLNKMKEELRVHDDRHVWRFIEFSFDNQLVELQCEHQLPDHLLFKSRNILFAGITLPLFQRGNGLNTLIFSITSSYEVLAARAKNIEKAEVSLPPLTCQQSRPDNIRDHMSLVNPNSKKRKLHTGFTFRAKKN